MVSTMVFVTTSKADDIAYDIARYMGKEEYSRSIKLNQGKTPINIEISVSRVNGGWNIVAAGTSFKCEKVHFGVSLILKSIRKRNRKHSKSKYFLVANKIKNVTAYNEKVFDFSGNDEVVKYNQSSISPRVDKIKTIIDVNNITPEPPKQNGWYL